MSSTPMRKQLKICNAATSLRALSTTIYPLGTQTNSTKTTAVNGSTDKPISDKAYTLPGRVATYYHYKMSSLPTLNAPSYELKQSDILRTALRHDQQRQTLKSYGNAFSHVELKGPLLPKTKQLECTVFDAPKLVKKEFMPLFPDRDILREKLTIVNIAHKTILPQDVWSASMEEEREALTYQFVNAASLVCNWLKSQGFWADFIDPSCGRPYLGAFTNSTLFETDDRYTHFGLRISDLGCCRVIEHLKWGTNVFVGTVFTNAAHESAAIVQLVELVNAQNNAETC